MRVMELVDWGLEHIRQGTRPDPVAGPGEVLLRMAAASVNYRDAVVLKRGYGRLSGTLPLIPLSDGAGRVVARGPGATRFAEGDLVCPIIMPGWHAGPLRQEHREALLGGPRDGVMRELMAVSEDDLVKAPSFYSAEEAAALAVRRGDGVERAQRRAAQARRGRGDARDGRRLAVRAAVRAHLRAPSRSSPRAAPKNARARRTMGADHVIDYRAEPEWSRAVRKIAPEGADLVIEVGGAGTLAQSLRAVRAGRHGGADRRARRARRLRSISAAS